jgi:hypothetical protein
VDHDSNRYRWHHNGDGSIEDTKESAMSRPRKPRFQPLSRDGAISLIMGFPNWKDMCPSRTKRIKEGKYK